MERSVLMVPLVKINAEHELKARLICLQLTRAFRYNLQVEAGNG